METKKCSKCKEVKAKAEFSKNRRAYDGLQSYCKLCWKSRKPLAPSKVANTTTLLRFRVVVEVPISEQAEVYQQVLKWQKSLVKRLNKAFSKGKELPKVVGANFDGGDVEELEAIARKQTHLTRKQKPYLDDCTFVMAPEQPDHLKH